MEIKKNIIHLYLTLFYECKKIFVNETKGGPGNVIFY